MQVAIVRFCVQFSKLVEILKLYPARNLHMINELCMSCVSKLLLKELLHDKQNQIELNNWIYSFSFLRFHCLTYLSSVTVHAIYFIFLLKT